MNSPSQIPNNPLPADFPYYQIVLDRSKGFSTIHGERLSEDPHAKVAAIQGGLPFDVNDRLVPDDGRVTAWSGIAADGKPVTYYPLYTPEMRAVAMRRAERLKKGRVQIEPEEEPKDADPQAGTNDVDLVNLSQWLKGQEDYTKKQVADAVAARYGKKVPENDAWKQGAYFLAYDESGPHLVHQSQMDGSLVQLCSSLVEAQR